MKDRSFYLAWQDHAKRGWYPVGRLDANAARDRFSFCYTKGAEHAQREMGFQPLYEFPDLHQKYEASELFPTFQNRIMTAGRRDFQNYLKLLDLEGLDPDPLEILAIDGGYRATDSYEVFPKISPDSHGCFKTRFFLHGWRYTNAAAQNRLLALVAGEPLYVTVELTNPATTTAVQIQTEDYHILGWAPRYLVHDLVTAMAGSPSQLLAKVVRVNPVPAPSKQRVLIELSAQLPSNVAPMQGEEFQELVLSASI
jgi:hypothetical protein